MDKQEQLEKCARLLSSRSTDDEKFAGLLLVPKIVAADDSNSLEYLFDRMDVKFIERLMRTGIKQAERQVAADADEDRAPAMLGVAIPVIDVFASHSSIATKPEMLDRIPTLCKVITLGLPTISTDAAQALCRILATTDRAVQMVIEKPEAFLGVVASAEAQQDPLETVQLIDFVVNKCSTYVHLQGTARHMQSWAGVASRIASIFDKSQSILKFELMPVLASCLEPIDRDDAVRCDGTGSCRMLVRHVSSGCASVLSQKSETTKFSDQALVLFSHLVRLWPSHVFSGSFLKSADAKEKAEANQRSVELILRLACIEGLSSIDTMMITPPDTKGRSAAHDSDAKRMRLGWKLPVCSETLAGWLEWVGRWLEDQQERPDVDDGCIYGVMSEVQKLADAAVAFLVDWKERVGSDQAMLKNGPAIVASVTRLLAQWLATDPNMHRKALPVLPMFTSWIQNSDSDGRAAIADYVRPCISFALDTCGIDEIRYVKDLKARELRHDRTRAQDYASPWVGTIEFDDLAHAVYNIPSDEEILQARREQP